MWGRRQPCHYMICDAWLKRSGYMSFIIVRNPSVCQTSCHFYFYGLILTDGFTQCCLIPGWPLRISLWSCAISCHCIYQLDWRRHAFQCHSCKLWEWYHVGPRLLHSLLGRPSLLNGTRAFPLSLLREGGALSLHIRITLRNLRATIPG